MTVLINIQKFSVGILSSADGVRDEKIFGVMPKNKGKKQLLTECEKMKIENCEIKTFVIKLCLPDTLKRRRSEKLTIRGNKRGYKPLDSKL